MTEEEINAYCLSRWPANADGDPAALPAGAAYWWIITPADASRLAFHGLADLISMGDATYCKLTERGVAARQTAAASFSFCRRRGLFAADRETFVVVGSGSGDTWPVRAWSDYDVATDDAKRLSDAAEAHEFGFARRGFAAPPGPTEFDDAAPYAHQWDYRAPTRYRAISVLMGTPSERRDDAASEGKPASAGWVRALYTAAGAGPDETQLSRLVRGVARLRALQEQVARGLGLDPTGVEPEALAIEIDRAERRRDNDAKD